MMIMRRKKTDKKKQEALLDELFREYIRKRAVKRAGGCERCHTPKRSYLELQTAHLHTRGGHTTRWDIRNAFGSCGGCHMFLDSHEQEKIDFALKLLGTDDYDSLYILAHMTTKQSPVDLKLKEIELRILLGEM